MKELFIFIKKFFIFLFIIVIILYYILIKKNNNLINLYDKILKCAELLNEKSLKGNANYLIISTKVAEIIENLNIKKHRKKKLQKIFRKNYE